MSVLVVPAIEGKGARWPTLGDQVATWIETHLVFGPGDLRGLPAKLDAEKRALLQRMYEVFPHGHAQAGRRRFRRVALSKRKGTAKSEFAAWIAAAELHPAAPVRFRDWLKKGRLYVPASGVGVTDPYIPLIAYTEEQSAELVYGALLAIIDMSKTIRGDFDLGLERVMRVGGDGKAVALATAPDARDGARTTFQVFDETHRLVLPRQKATHRTMLANLPKRFMADPWSLETTTAPSPGEGSVAEDTMEYARAIADGRAKDSRFFFFHRQASEGADLENDEGVREAVLEASGPDATWSDVDGIVDQWKDPTADRAYLARVWLNMPVRATDRAFDMVRWGELVKPGYSIPKGAGVTIGFDGARRRDATALVVTEIATGFQILWGLWEQPFGEQGKGWEVPESEVSSRVAEAFKFFRVWRLYADPPYWETTVDTWAGEFTSERVVKWYTNRDSQMGPAVRAYSNAIKYGDVHHDGDARFSRHLGNCYRRTVNVRNDKGEWEPFFVLHKERHDSPNKIDVGPAAVVSWKARLDALADGQARVKAKRSTEVLVCG